MQLMHNYGTEAFLLQWLNFVAIRGAPLKVVSDRGSQLTSANNYVTWEGKEDPSKWGWNEISEKAARGGTEWEFVPAGCQWRNGLAESRVKAMKSTLSHMMAATLINSKPTITYAELAVVLARAASIINDRPIGLRSLTEHDIVPITPNQLLLGRTSTTMRSPSSEEVEDYGRCSRYQEELLDSWWNLWKVQVFPHLLPHNGYKAAKRHLNLRVGDVCLLKYDGKIRGTYRLCRITEIYPDDHGVVRTLMIAYRPKKKETSLPYVPRTLDTMVVGVQRLVLIQAEEDKIKSGFPLTPKIL